MSQEVERREFFSALGDFLVVLGLILKLLSFNRAINQTSVPEHLTPKVEATLESSNEKFIN